MLIKINVFFFVYEGLLHISSVFKNVNVLNNRKIARSLANTRLSFKLYAHYN